MPEHVRIKDPATGAEFTYDTAKVDALGLSAHVIDKPALGPDGLPAPTKPKLPLGEPLPGGDADRRRTRKQTAGATASGEEAGQSSADTDKEI